MRINLAAESLLDCIEIQVAGKPIHELCPEGSGDAQIFKLIQEQISSWHGDMEVCKFRGEPFPAKVALSAVLDGEGRRVGVLAVIDDRSEQVALQRRLEHAHKLELAGRMAGSIAHDLNNLLQPIIGYTHLALEHAPEDARLQRYLQTVVKASGRATDLVAQFLLFSGRPRIAVMRLAVPPLLDECARTIRGKLPAAITIRQELAADLPALLGDGTQIQRILLNLAVNAGHAMPKGGTLTLAADAEVLDGLADCFGARLSGPFVRLSVTDTGVGMDAETLEQIWDPFFTTRGAGEGLGLGLAMLRSIVELHKGGVEVCSTPGVGTTFAIHLPATAHGAQPETPVVAAVAGSGTILFVDDEEMVCSLAKAVLERVGYVVRTERQSPEALALFQANPARWDLVITDLAMPNLRGDALARQMREARPDIPIILCTGNLHAGGAGQEPPLEFSDILFKPAEPSQLCLQVRRTLEGVRLGA